MCQNKTITHFENIRTGSAVHLTGRSNTSVIPDGASIAAMPTSLRPLTRDEVMTAHEVAGLLHLPVSTVYQLARQGELPARRLGRTWRFLRPNLEQLLRS
jgi:excisionase family DNA binding protein